MDRSSIIDVIVSEFLPGADCPSVAAAETGDVDPCKCGVNDMDWLCAKNKQT